LVWINTFSCGYFLYQVINEFLTWASRVSIGFCAAQQIASDKKITDKKPLLMSIAMALILLYRVLTYNPLSSSANLFFRAFHFPLVKSGKACGVLPPAIDFSDSGVITLMVTES